MYTRDLQYIIESKLGKGKALILLGPRQVGKTTLIHQILSNKPHVFLDGDDPTVRSLLTNPNTEEIQKIIGTHNIVFIDELQRIPNIGITLKIITDQFKKVQLFASGSSAFEIANHVNESLTGRKWQYILYPISWKEFENYHGYLNALKQLELRLLYGFYPDVLNQVGNENQTLMELVNSYLYKDILAYAGIRKPDILEKLLRALALQIGNEVSYNELSQLIGVDKNTISNYIDLLEQSYVIFKLTSFSKNIRDEIKTNRKLYFYDVGIRNAIIQNLNPLELRNDKGVLWENFIIAERLKQNAYKQRLVKMYFWRTKNQQEIDLVEEGEGKIVGFEIKWNKKANVKIPKIFEETYKTKVSVINQENFSEFIS